MSASDHESIRSVDVFVIRHRLDPRTGPSIALADEHRYVIVKITDEEGRSGWGETYAIPGVASVVEEVAIGLLGRSAQALRELVAGVRWSSEHPYAGSALAIALEDLRARQLGISVASLFGGQQRERARAYAASGGYVEGRDPAETWPAERDRLLERGFTAWKLRIGRYPISHEAALLERLRAELPASFELMADGNAGYLFAGAVTMGRILERLGFAWFEEPMAQRDGYVGYERLARTLDIALAAGEILAGRGDARGFLARGCADIVQPEPVICGGVAETIFISELAALHGVAAFPHTSNNVIGIAAALQVLAVLPAATRSPAAPDLYLEYGIDDNPHRSGLLATPLEFRDGWVTIPDGPGLGIEIDQDYLRHYAVGHRQVGPAG